MLSPIRVIGVDHGLHHTGYGLLVKMNKQISCLAWGTIDTSPRIPFAQRLKQIYHELIEVIGRWTPDVMAVESAIYAQNVRTALLMGHARGAALLAAANSDLEIFEYSPKKIKSAVVGNGAATKEQVRFMITRILNLRETDIPFDASDALAVGICHLNQLQLR
ncbi:crossover junction endodeoxyribonuclease RuvC [bacterium]|nr:crossover junction endodeoxyribonuclease RuvC [bacterium]MBU1633872.1 crossover junction endodeoxyribonuclease RuvC [bacterium]MBU1872959.1 crossover junction endodeoxyribonuclease RuvC [bacterium]